MLICEKVDLRTVVQDTKETIRKEALHHVTTLVRQNVNYLCRVLLNDSVHIV